jgi:hypothetical protein
VTSLLTAGVLGLGLSLFTGLLENRPDASLIGASYYGLPLAWRPVKTFQPSEIQPLPLALNMAIWGVILFLALMLLPGDREAWPLCHNVKTAVSGFPYRRFLPWVLVSLPVGFLMDLFHESGHALWGTMQGGTLTYLQIAFFQLYPFLALAPDFRLGYTVVEGLSSPFSRGVFLLGGSVTTHVASWLLGLLLQRRHLGYNTRVLLWTLGLFGLLDLPFYVFFPQIGLQHWIFIGGSSAEPLLGARLMGLPDPLFYFLTGLATLFLGVLYTTRLPSLTDRSNRRELARKF